MHEHAARTACHIVNILAADMPKHEQYSKILHLILSVVRDCRAERDRIIFHPSEN